MAGHRRRSAMVRWRDSPQPPSGCGDEAAEAAEAARRAARASRDRLAPKCGMILHPDVQVQQAWALRVAGQSKALTSTMVDGAMAVHVDTAKLPVPEKSYHASTADAAITEDGLCRFVFAQVRALSRKTIQNAVIIEMPRPCVKIIQPTFNSEFRQRLQSATVGKMLAFPPEDNGDVSSLSYSAHVCRLFVNTDVGAAIDFYELPITGGGPMTDVRPVIRISCSPALASMFVSWCDKFSGEV